MRDPFTPASMPQPGEKPKPGTEVWLLTRLCVPPVTERFGNREEAMRAWSDKGFPDLWTLSEVDPRTGFARTQDRHEATR